MILTFAAIAVFLILLRRRELFPGLYYPPSLSDSAVRLARKRRKAGMKCSL